MSLHRRSVVVNPYLEALRAEAHLAQMDLHEPLAEQSEQAPWTLLQHQFAVSYRELVGVPPDQRHELRQALARVVEGSGMAVADVLEAIRHRYASSGLSSSGS